MTTDCQPTLRRLSSLVVLVGAAGALAAPSAVARPTDMAASTPRVAQTTPHVSAYTQRVEAHRMLGVIGPENGPASQVVKATGHTDGAGESFSWGAAGIGAGGAVLGAGLIVLAGREASRRRVRVSQA